MWVAAKGPRLIKAAARWGDALNLNVVCTGVKSVREPFATLDQACREINRNPATIARTGYTFITFARPSADMSGARAKALRGSPEEIAAQLHALHEAGMEHLTLYVDTGEHERALSSYPLLNSKAIELLAPVTQALRKLEAGG